jgi:hypothetical protein
MTYILVTFYITMAAAGYVVEFLFQALGIIPQNRNVVTITEGIQWNYTSILNILFFAAGCHPGDPLYPDRWHTHAADDGDARARHFAPSRLNILLLPLSFYLKRPCWSSRESSDASEVFTVSTRRKTQAQVGDLLLLRPGEKGQVERRSTCPLNTISLLPAVSIASFFLNLHVFH